MEEDTSSNFSVGSIDRHRALPSARKVRQTAFVAFANQSPTESIRKRPCFSVQYQLLENAATVIFPKIRSTRVREMRKATRFTVRSRHFWSSQSFCHPGVLVHNKGRSEFVEDGSVACFTHSETVSRLNLRSSKMKHLVSSWSPRHPTASRAPVHSEKQTPGDNVSYETDFLEPCISTSRKATRPTCIASRLEKGKRKPLPDAGINRQGRFSYYGGDLRLFVRPHRALPPTC